MSDDPSGKATRTVLGVAISGESARYTAGVLVFQGSRLAVNLIAAAVLGPAIFGSWVLISLVIQYSSMVSLGVPNGMGREVPIDLGAGRETAAIRAEATALTATLALGVAGGVVVGLGLLVFGGPGLDDAVVALVVGAAVLSQQGFLLGQMLLRSRLAFATAAILMVVVGGITLLGGLALLPLGVVGLAASQALAQAAGLGVALRLGPPTPRPGWDADVARRLIGIGLPLMLAGIAFLVLTTIDRWLVLAFLGSEALGVYGIVGLAVSAPLVVVAIISQQAYPRLAFALGAGRPGSEILAMARRQSRIAFGIGMAVVLAVGTAGWFGIPVFLPEYDAARVPLLLALIGVLAYAASSGDANVLTTIGAQKEYLVIQVAAIGGYLVIGIFLLDLGLGLVGVGAASALTFVGYAACLRWRAPHAIRHRSEIGGTPDVGPLPADEAALGAP